MVLVMVKIGLFGLGVIAEKMGACMSGWVVLYFCSIANVNLCTWKSLIRLLDILSLAK